MKMKEVHRKGIDYHIIDTDLRNQKPVQGVFKEARYKWYHTMVNKRAPRKLLDRGVSFVSEVMQMNHSSDNSVNGGIILKNMTVNAENLSGYLDLGVYDKVWFKGDYCLSPSEPGR